MKSIFEYKDYRLYLQDYLDERKRYEKFSWRMFCREAGFSSPNFLKQVRDGAWNLSKVKSGQVAKAMGLVEYEEEYFKQLVVFGNACDDDVKKAALAEMQRIAHEHKERVIGRDALQYYESWKYPVIRELAPLMPGAEPRDIAEECKEYVSAEEVRDILEFLVDAGFLKKERDKVYSQTDQTVIGSKEALSNAIRSMHKEMGSMALRAVDRYSAKERFFTGITIGVDEIAYDKVVDAIKDCCKKVVAIVSANKKTNQVCRVNFQLFPVTNRIEEKKHA